MSEVVYSIEGVGCSIGGATILSEVSASVARGSCVAVIGPNGAGKTTLLKCLNRIMRPDAGTISLNGIALDRLEQREIARQVAYVPQASSMAFTMKVYDFVMLGRYPHLSPFTTVSAEDKEAVEAALGITGIEAFRDRKLDTLSGGERQTAFIAAALAQGGDTLLLDEPTTYLDYAHQMDVLNLIERLHRDEGKTIVLVTHDVNHAVAVSDHIVALNEGRVVFDDTAAALLEGDTLSGIFGTRFQILDRDGASSVIVPEGRDS